MPSPSPLASGIYIAGPFYDWVYFILAPLLAVAIGYLVMATGAYQYTIVTPDASGTLRQIAVPAMLSAAFTHAHLVIVFFRSHLDGNIFRLYAYRFTVVPITLLFASIASQWVFVIASVLTIWWDI